MKIKLLTATIAVMLAARDSCSQSLRASATIAPRQGVEMGSGVATVQTRTGAMDVEVAISNRGGSSYVVQVIREDGRDALQSPPAGSSTVMRGGENREVRFRVGPAPAAPAGAAPPRITYVISPMI